MHALFVPQRVLMATPAVTSARAFLSTTGVTATWTAPTVATRSEIVVRCFLSNLGVVECFIVCFSRYDNYFKSSIREVDCILVGVKYDRNLGRVNNELNFF